MNPMYMIEIFKLRQTRRAVRKNYKLNLGVAIISQVGFDDKNLRY